MLKSKPHTCERDLIQKKSLADVMELRIGGIDFRGDPHPMTRDLKRGEETGKREGTHVTMEAEVGMMRP